MLNISIISDYESWMNSYIPAFICQISKIGHHSQWFHDVKKITKGDFVFYLGCGQIVSSDILMRNRHNLVVHESDLPSGRGWSPLTWQILEGKNKISITLFEDQKEVDSGIIYLQKILKFKGSELIVELRRIQAEASMALCLKFIQNYSKIVKEAFPQNGKPTYYQKRTVADSRLDVDKTIRDQFNLLRVVDNEKYPAFFEMNGKTYILKIFEKSE